MKIFSFGYILIIQIYFADADVCEFCICENFEKWKFMKIDCSNKRVDLTNIVWPASKDSNVTVIFEQNGLRYLPIISDQGQDLRIRDIILDNNDLSLVDSRSFIGLPSLNAISLKNNKFKVLNHGMFESAKNLTSLSLNNNTISSIEKGVFNRFNKLRRVDLGNNKLRDFNIEIFGTYITSLNLDNNDVFSIATNENGFKSNIQKLSLANNNLATISDITFKHLPELTHLTLRGNSIKYIETNSFKNLSKLDYLDLSFNQITHFEINLPHSIQHLKLSNNKLEVLEFHNKMENLKTLEIQYNSIFLLQLTDNGLKYLKKLNASHNEIENLLEFPTPGLEVLDLSYNAINLLKKAIFTERKNLSMVDLSGNPLTKLDFPQNTSLKQLYLNNLTHIRTIRKGLFESITDQCLDLSISHCRHLSVIEEKAFANIQFCKLDLSFNDLNSLPQNLVNWTTIRDGIDLQHNHFNCSCEAQWMLDEILVFLYTKKHLQHYLKDLRCATPDDRRGHRFVRYYKRIGAFCHAFEALKLEISEPEEIYEDMAITRAGPGLYIVIVLVILVIIATIAVVVHIHNRNAKIRKDGYGLIYK